MSDLMPMPFPNPSTYEGHSGVDFGQPFGTPILASAHGRVTYTGWLNDNAGYSTIVTYDNGVPVLYCHQPGYASLPAVGEVWLGSEVGKVGSSGHSTGPHLHGEIMAGSGAHTYAGFWNYFTANAYVGGGSGAGGGSVPFNPANTEDVMALRVITSPYYRAAKQMVVHNGLAATSIPNAEGLDLRQGGVQSHDYDEEYKFNNEISRVWNLGKLVSTTAAEAMTAEFGERLS